MDLIDYLKQQNETISAFASRADLAQPTVWRIAKRKVVPSPALAFKIEQATGGAVTRDELLYPELYVSSQSPRLGAIPDYRCKQPEP